MRQFLRIFNESEMRLLALIDDDIARAALLLEQYADSQLDFADAAIMALAERYNITRVATFDRRDFSIIRPQHTAFFELLP